MKEKVEVKLIEDESLFESPSTHSTPIGLSELLEGKMLVSPSTNAQLSMTIDASSLTDGSSSYALLEGSPILYPEKIQKALVDGELPLEYHSDSLLQYVLLSQIKQRGEINAPYDSTPVLKHKYRLSEFCKSLEGNILDVGCDSPTNSMPMFPSSCRYVGLDPYAQAGDFRVIGIGEILPFANESMDNVIFNTSLDHILDFHTAFEESLRVLRPGGQVIVTGYVWLSRATLLTDAVHFHHFREVELTNAIDSLGFEITRLERYKDPKNSDHRYCIYLSAEKR